MSINDPSNSACDLVLPHLVFRDVDDVNLRRFLQENFQEIVRYITWARLNGCFCCGEDDGPAARLKLGAVSDPNPSWSRFVLDEERFRDGFGLPDPSKAVLEVQRTGLYAASARVFIEHHDGMIWGALLLERGGVIVNCIDATFNKESASIDSFEMTSVLFGAKSGDRIYPAVNPGDAVTTAGALVGGVEIYSHFDIHWVRVGDETEYMNG